MKFQMRHVVRFDMLRLKEQSLFKRYSPPERNLEIIKSVIGLERFLDLYKNDKVVA
jgi:hypothetical protein